ncbi:MAG TPA: phage holin family protein [Ktedonobacterales bacterium]
MLRLLLRWVLSAVVFVLIASIVPGIHVTWGAAFVAAIIAGLLNMLVRPILVLLTLPVTLLTLGLFLFVVNAAIFGLTALLVPGFKVDGFWAALIGAVLYWLLNMVINNLFERRKEQPAA